MPVVRDGHSHAFWRAVLQKDGDYSKAMQSAAMSARLGPLMPVMKRVALVDVRCLRQSVDRLADFTVRDRNLRLVVHVTPIMARKLGLDAFDARRRDQSLDLGANRREIVVQIGRAS